MKKLFAILLAVLCVSAFSQRKIESAFGQTLGEKVLGALDEDQVEGLVRITFEPTEKLRGFENYLVLVTPKTRKVCFIRCSQAFSSKYDALEKAEALQKIYERFYSGKFEKDTFSSGETVFSLVRAGRILSITVSGDGSKYEVIVSLMDSDLRKLADKEAEESAGSQTGDADKSSRKIGPSFGQKLGEGVVGGLDVKRSGKRVMVFYEPEKKFHGFGNYFAEVTPITRKIYSESCSRVFNSKAEAIHEVNAILKLCERAYRGKFKSSSSSSRNASFILFQKRRTFSVFLNAIDSKYEVSIAVKDLDLEQQAKKEAEELEKQMARVVNVPQHKIESAFGQTLGKDVVDALEEKRRNGLVCIFYEPREKFRGFGNFNVMVTPRTRNIYWIECFQTFNSKAEALEEQAAILKIYEEAYAGRFKKAPASLAENDYTLFQGDRSVSVSVDQVDSKYEVKILFADIILTRQAKKEAQEPDVSQAGSADGSQQKIESAFGQTLGKEVVGGLEEKRRNGLVNISYEPRETFRGFGNFNVMVTPLTRKVYWIDGSQTFNSKAEALEEQANVLKIYGGTYAGRFKKAPGSPDDNDYTLFQGERAIKVCVDEVDSKYEVKIIFVDVDLSRQAKKEAQEPDVSQAGSADGSQQKIESAFGQTLGKEVVGGLEEKRRNGLVCIFYNPREKFRGFGDYDVMVTPLTRKIYWIGASQTFNSKAEALEEQANVLKIYGGTYAGRFKKAPASLHENSYTLFQKDRAVSISVDEVDSKYEVKITFIDDRLLDQSKKEAQEPGVSQTASANGPQRKIESAFWQTLGGDIPSGLKVMKIGILLGSSFAAKGKFRGYTDFTLLATPKTRKICQIGGTQSFNSMKDAFAEQDAVRKILEDIYKCKFQKTEDSPDKRVFEWRQGNRAIRIVAELGVAGEMCGIYYYDLDLSKQAEKETKEMENQ